MTRSREAPRLRPSLRTRITGGVLLPLYYRVSGIDVVSLQRELENDQWLGREALEHKQARRIREILLHAWDHVPFYRKRFEATGMQRADLEERGILERIPPLTKQEVIEHCEEFVDTSNPRPLEWSTTGGSTGETVRFCQDRAALASIKAREMRFHHWMGVQTGERIARLWGSPIDREKAYTLKERLLRRIKNVCFLDGYDLSEAAMAAYAKRLREFRPQLLIAFTTCLNILAEYMEEHGLGGVRPRAILTTSSPLYPSYRARFERLFECPVFDEYGSREFGGMAHECPAHQGLHVDMEDVHIEVTRARSLAPAGDTGELLVTGLFNRAFPLIRYPIGDLGRHLSQPCACGRGSTLIEIVKGRSSELLMGPKGIPVLGEYFIDVFDSLPGEVRKFRIHQTGAKTLRVVLVAAPAFGEGSRRYVLEAIAQKFGDEMEVEFEYMDEIPPLPSGKQLLTINETSPKPTDRGTASQEP